MRRLVVGGTAGLTAALTAVSWRGLVLVGLLVVVTIGAICWVVSDAGRTRRMATLIRAARVRVPPDKDGQR
jgi:hypothetical protein